MKIDITGIEKDILYKCAYSYAMRKMGFEEVPIITLNIVGNYIDGESFDYLCGEGAMFIVVTEAGKKTNELKEKVLLTEFIANSAIPDEIKDLVELRQEQLLAAQDAMPEWQKKIQKPTSSSLQYTKII